MATAKECVISNAVTGVRNKMPERELDRIIRGGPGYNVVLPSLNESVASGRLSNKGPHFFYFYRDVITRLGLQFPFSDFQMCLLRHLHLVPSQLHPNGWAFALAFENYCKKHKLKCSVHVFCSFFSPLETNMTVEEEKMWYGWTSLRACHRRKFLKSFTDSWKGFKTSFFKVVAKVGEVPWFLQRSPSGEIEERFPLYWGESHHKFHFKDFLPAPSQRSDSEDEAIVTLTSLVSKKGPLVDSAEYIICDRSKPVLGMIFVIGSNFVVFA
jgi:Putative gypsy type transposon